jgi:hypothetical protein
MENQKKKNTHFVVDFILAPINVLAMFWVFFLKDDCFSIETIVNHKLDTKIYLALLFAVIFQILLRKTMKTN